MRDIYETCTFTLAISESMNYEEEHPCEEWRRAMKEEFETIQKNGIWDLVDAPSDNKIIGLKWIYKTKYNGKGKAQKHKSKVGGSWLCTRTRSRL